jgi:hypothetical protein
MSDVPAKTKAVGFKLTVAQHGELEARAARAGVRLSTWMRSILLQAATQKPQKGYLQIREPDGTIT